MMKQNMKQLPEVLPSMPMPGTSAQAGGDTALLCARRHHFDMGSTWALPFPLHYSYVDPKE